MGHVSRSVYVDVLDETINPVEKVFCFDFVKHILDFLFGLFLGTSVVHFHHIASPSCYRLSVANYSTTVSLFQPGIFHKADVQHLSDA